MIVKILSKTSFRSTSTGLKYIMDEDKCLTPVAFSKDDLNEDEIDSLKKQIELNFVENVEDRRINAKEKITKVINYMANENKIKKKYITGFLCTPETANEEFIQNIDRILDKRGQSLDDITGNISYHIVQSFPENLEISDEEVHQCGIELVKKLGIYQAVIASHVHPVVKNEYEVKGKCKHNHIIFNAYRLEKFIDPEHPDVIKYHDCKETYNQLQIYNDEIARDHGLPIIVEPDMDKTYSWFENEQINKGTSWKERVRIDIENSKRISSNWDEFTSIMVTNGYKFKAGKHITYIAPDIAECPKHVVRDYKLGNEFTKKSIENYFEVKKSIQANVDVEEIISPQPNVDIKKLLNQFGELNVMITINKSGKFASENHLETKKYTMMVPLTKPLLDKTLNSYFVSDQVYEVCDKEQKTVANIVGRDLYLYFSAINQDVEKNIIDRLENEMNEYNDNHFRIDYQNKAVYNPRWINSKTKQLYKVCLYDRDGRRRTSLELLIILAMLIVNKESIHWQKQALSNEDAKQPIYASRNWKLQQMLDTLTYTKEKNIHSIKEIKDQQNKTGKTISMINRELRAIEKVQNKMQYLKDALDFVEKDQRFFDELYKMPKSIEKERIILKNKEELENYTDMKAVLYRNKLSTIQEKLDFIKRYEDIQRKIDNLNKQCIGFKKEYRKLKQIEYNVQLMQNQQFVCGVEYDFDRIMANSAKKATKNKGIER